MSSKNMLRMVSTPLTFAVLLTMLGVGVYWGYKTFTAKVEGPPPESCQTIPMTTLEPSSVTVNVYNGGNQRGLAGRIADHLSTNGFIVNDISNTDVKVETILIIGAAVDNPEVLLVAGWFADPNVRADNRPDHSVDIVLGNSYDERIGLADDPPLSLELPGGVVCLPPVPTPTPTDTETMADPTPTSTPT